MAETAKMTRKEKIAAGIPKAPKRKTTYANALKDRKADQVKVSLRNYRSSARKMRLIVDQIRGREVVDALSVLKFTPKAGAPAVSKLVRAAIASYEEKFDGEQVDLGTHYIKEAYVDSARMLKRIQPAPQGRAHLIRKRYCHITLVLEEIPYEEEDDDSQE